MQTYSMKSVGDGGKINNRCECVATGYGYGHRPNSYSIGTRRLRQRIRERDGANIKQKQKIGSKKLPYITIKQTIKMSCRMEMSLLNQKNARHFLGEE